MIKRHIKKTLLGFSASLLLAAILPIPLVSAQQSAPSPAASPALADRVEKLESNIGQILQILKQQQSTASPTSPAGQATPAASPAASQPPNPAPSASNPSVSLKPGAILELWLLKGDFSGDAPTGRSVGGMIDQGDYFNLLNFTEEPSLATQQTNRVALRWLGLFRAKESGVYVFTLEWSRAAGRQIADAREAFWTADLSIDTQTLIKESPGLGMLYRSDNSSLSYSAASEVQLEAGGIYPLSLLTFIASQNALPTTSWNYDKMKLTLKVRGPSDMTPKTITAKDLFHK